MRIRMYRQKDFFTVLPVQQEAARADGTEIVSEEDFEAWLSDPEVVANAFIVTDDDDELNTWGQAGTLEGIEGETVGYTVLQMEQDAEGYHLQCRGSVHPDYRRQNGGRLLLVGALNRARALATEFEMEAEEEGLPVYFEALLPVRDPASERLAAKFEMLPVAVSVPDGLQLYRREL